DARIAFNSDSNDESSQIDTNRQDIELLGAFHLGKWNTFTVGVEQIYEYGRNRSSGGFLGPGVASVFSKQLDNFAYFLQNEVRLFDRVILSAGRRHDDPSAFESGTTSRFGLVVRVPETDTRVRGSWGEGFRAPTINDLFFPGFANPNLKPERSESWEAGVDQSFFKKRVRLGATYFENKFDDLIQFVSVGGLFRPVNVAKAWTQGEEVTIEIEPIDRLLFTANYTHVETKDFSTRGELRRVPHHVGNIGVTWTPIPALTVYTQINVVSSQGDLAFDPVLFVSTPVRNPGYYRIDLGGVYNIVPKRGNFRSDEGFQHAGGAAPGAASRRQHRRHLDADPRADRLHADQRRVESGRSRVRPGALRLDPGAESGLLPDRSGGCLQHRAETR